MGFIHFENLYMANIKVFYLFFAIDKANTKIKVGIK